MADPVTSDLLSLARALEPRLRDRLAQLVEADSQAHRYLHVAQQLQRSEDLVVELRKVVATLERRLGLQRPDGDDLPPLLCEAPSCVDPAITWVRDARGVRRLVCALHADWNGEPAPR